MGEKKRRTGRLKKKKNGLVGFAQNKNTPREKDFMGELGQLRAEEEKGTQTSTPEKRRERSSYLRTEKKNPPPRKKHNKPPHSKNAGKRGSTSSAHCGRKKGK